MPLSDGDRRHPVQKSAHRLGRGLSDRIGRSAGDNNGSVAITSTEGGAADQLREPTDQADCSRRAKRGPVMLVHAVLQAGIAKLVEPLEMVQSGRGSVWHHD